VDDLDYFKATYGLRDRDVLLVPFGSRVYGTHTDESDFDYLAIVPANRIADSCTEYRRNRLNVQLYNRRDFQRDLDQHRVHALEAYFLPGSGVPAQFSLRLRRRLLREAWLRKSSHSFVRAKKKMEIERAPALGRKSLFHALRILDFGAQIGTHGSIIDYASANGYWFAIRDAGRADWDYHRELYQPIHRRLASALRKATAE
jgi:hypothetical protein